MANAEGYDYEYESLSVLRLLTRSHRRTLAPRPPKQLHHYTGPSGLLGIIDSRSLFLSDASFLNDQSEIIYARDLIATVLAELASAADGPQGRLLQATSRRFLVASKATAALRYYVACFCEDGNLLSQWRAYGQPGSG